MSNWLKVVMTMEPKNITRHNRTIKSLTERAKTIEKQGNTAHIDKENI